jgi:hypothetical protein
MTSKEILEGAGNPLTTYELGQMRRNEFPSIIRDKIRNPAPGSEHVQLIVSHEIALQIAQDLDLAIAKSPGLSYGG